MGELIHLHPKWLNRWANIYVSLYLDEKGPGSAKDWALKTLGAEEISAIKPIINKKFKERGYGEDRPSNDPTDA